MKKNKQAFQWNKVTPLSKYVAMTLFVVLPFIGFFMGTTYQAETAPIKNLNTANTSETRLEISSDYKYMRLGQKLYALPETVVVPTNDVPTNLEWHFITKINNSFISDPEIFDYKQVPNSNSFVYTLAFRPILNENDQGGRLFRTYLNNGKTNQKIHESIWSLNSYIYNVPRIYDFSQDGRYIRLNLYVCWGCGGHYPQTLLIDTKHPDNNFVNLGQINDFAFSWGNEGSYSYKQGSKTITKSLKYPVKGE